MKERGLSYEEDLKAATECMLKGGIILYPTDTVWGIGCDARNENAVRRIYELKRRADRKSMLVLTDSTASLEKLVDEIPEVAYELIEASDRPLTLIYDKAAGVAPNLIAPDGSLGVRITHEPFSRELCRRMKGAVVSTSANISGQPAPAVFKDISDEIKQGVDYVVNYRQDDNTSASPSHIIKLGKGGLFKILR